VQSVRLRFACSLKILCLIPARRNSKRLKGKNKKLLGGLPLFIWSIRSAKNIPEICDILISTDDPTIAKIARKEKVLVPWLRPKKLASDSAKSVDVALHGLKWYTKNKKKVDGLILFQPTSPFRKKDSIRKAIKIFKRRKFRAVVSVSKAKKESHARTYYQENNLKALKKNKKYKYKNLFHPNGSIYLTSPRALIKQKTFFQKETYALLTKSKKEALDIDTEQDFCRAQLYLKR